MIGTVSVSGTSRLRFPSVCRSESSLSIGAMSTSHRSPSAWSCWTESVNIQRCAMRLACANCPGNAGIGGVGGGDPAYQLGVVERVAAVGGQRDDLRRSARRPSPPAAGDPWRPTAPARRSRPRSTTLCCAQAAGTATASATVVRSQNSSAARNRTRASSCPDGTRECQSASARPTMRGSAGRPPRGPCCRSRTY